MRELRDHLPGHRFVLRTDVKSCYASINYVPLVDQLAARISDRRVLNLGLFYIRFMDDILVLAPTRWHCAARSRWSIGCSGAPDLEKHPDKAFIGRVERGFDVLSYRFTRAGLRAARKTIASAIANPDSAL